METGTIANNTNGTMGKLTILDPFNSVTGQTFSFSYDDLGRLSTDNCGNSIWNDTYTYSPTGNIYKSGTTTFDPTYSSATNRFSTLPAGTPIPPASSTTGLTAGWSTEAVPPFHSITMRRSPFTTT